MKVELATNNAAVGYARVSTKKDEQDSSFSSQKLYFEEVVEQPKYNHMQLIHVYQDKMTATKFKRKGFLEMLEDAGLQITLEANQMICVPVRPSKFKYILVSNLSRFARDVLSVAPLRALRDNGVYVIFLDSGKSTEDDSDWLYVTMMMTFAENESRDKSIKQKNALMRTASRGTLMTNGKLFGYDYNTESKVLTINEDEAATVRTIFELYASGEGFRNIANLYNLKTRSGNQFTASSVSNLLENEKYCGTLIRNKHTNGSVFHKHAPKLNPVSEQKPFEDVIPAIISKELFEQCQAIRDSRADGKRGINNTKSEYTDILKCGNCGANYTKNIHRGQVFYNCGTKKTKGSKICANKNVYLPNIEYALEQVKSGSLYLLMVDSRDYHIEKLNHVKASLESRIDSQNSKEADSHREKIEDLKKQRKKLITLYLDDNFDKQTLDEMSGDIDNQINRLSEELVDLTKSNDVILKEIQQIDEMIDQVSKIDLKKIDTSNVIEHIQTITVDSDGHLEFKFNLFEKLNKYGMKSINFLSLIPVRD
ncbi:recombinase family protein [Paenibacillus frigoriresistens]|uniref:recombinase family protein n=1 Tax=Paenibacillus alginolyticus TaxID=59839 RepID=UPI00156670F0|nr:recombinase family protein [Paenibacillus frigoriresistens]NRF94819.1 recombinase family protein [Paenibacillus frigoriresistens]